MHFIHEHFKNIDSLLNTLESRPKNDIMKYENSSTRTSDYEWYQTRDYNEALQIMRDGYKDILPKIRAQMDKKARTYHQYSALPKAMPQNTVVGYIPNVPNAIRNLPNSMITIERQPQKRKTLSVIYNIGGCSRENADFFINAGTTICTALNIVELHGIQTQLSVGFMPARTDEDNEEGMCPTLTIKDYGQKFDLQKICFPLAHPSMFRRFGFAYLETCPEITKKEWHYAYGMPFDNLTDLNEALKIDNEKTFLLNCQWIRDNNYDVKKVLDFFKVSKER